VEVVGEILKVALLIALIQLLGQVWLVELVGQVGLMEILLHVLLVWVSLEQVELAEVVQMEVAVAVVVVLMLLERQVVMVQPLERLL
jgi:presenilin-like A22 family membrane protease